MRVNNCFKYISFLKMTILLFVFFVIGINNLKVRAEDTTENIGGYIYNLDEDSKYEVNIDGEKTAITDGTQLGKLSLSGAIKSTYDLNGFKSFEISEGNVTFNYVIGNNIVDKESSVWNITEDGAKSVNKIELDEKINNGALILQSSLDNKKWTTLKTVTNIAGGSFKSDFYSTTDIQQINGTYFRVIIAYKAKKQLDDKKILFVNVDNFEYKNCVELYQFYLIDNDEMLGNVAKPSDTPKKELGSKVKTQEDKGFSGTEIIDKKDPHYGWDIGTFYINGYTRETKDTDETPVFIKKVGDRVTLWFDLKQDIKKLNNNDKLSIASDKNASDQYFETPVTNFKRGALIIRFTDYEGKKHDPVIYTDYLAANASTTADTKVELFEEGDYEVALDYSIKDSKGVNSSTDYRIFFKYKVRNGNSMAFPFDIVTGDELSNKSITENGFKFDMAKSRYLNIDVTRTVLNRSGNDIKEDIRYNRPAKDGDVYKEEGIYSFSVKNIYTNESTEKVIYVGSDPILKALAKNNISVNELEQKLKDGYELDNSGNLSLPHVEEIEGKAENVNNQEMTTEKPFTENDETSEIDESDGENNISEGGDSEPSVDANVENATLPHTVQNNSVISLIIRYRNIIIGVLAAIIVLIIGIIIGKGKSGKGD